MLLYTKYLRLSKMEKNRLNLNVRSSDQIVLHDRYDC